MATLSAFEGLCAPTNHLFPTSRSPINDTPSNFSLHLLGLIRATRLLFVHANRVDDIIQLIFYDLPDPGPLTQTSTRFHRFSQDPYVRAHYFLNRYGNVQAMFYALGRGGIVNERVIDILFSSGAHVSRYLCQIAMHHYFYVQSRFIKTTWVRGIPLKVFTYFIQLCDELYDAIPRGKNEDDGYIFATFLKESKYPPSQRTITWDVIKDVFEKYKFIPFYSKDPIMIQFPLVLAIEPRLLPYANANGFSLDSSYRDFVFRRMFERPTPGSDRGVDDIVNNVSELCKLDSSMYVTRTVAAEICMEARTNEDGYKALKRLDKQRILLFDLSTLVHDLLKLFVKTRSITTQSTQSTLRLLYQDFPIEGRFTARNTPPLDATVRLVLLLTVFVNAEHQSAASLQLKLDELNLGRLTMQDVGNLLINPFMERHQILYDYLRQYGLAPNVDSHNPGATRFSSSKGMSPVAIKAVMENIAISLLELDYKGKMLKKLTETLPSIHSLIEQTVLERYQIDVDDLPAQTGSSPRSEYSAKLCKNWFTSSTSGDYFWHSQCPKEDIYVSMTGEDEVKPIKGEDSASSEDVVSSASTVQTPQLGHIGQESLSTMIRQDELIPTNRSRRRFLLSFGVDSGALFPIDPVGKWIKNEFGCRSRVTAVFMIHAVINNNFSVLRHYLSDSNRMEETNILRHVPITFKHFQLMAHLGREPNALLFEEIKNGAEFYWSEDDYILGPTSIPSRAKKRRRSAQRAARSCSTSMPMQELQKEESNLQLWIDNLGDLLKTEHAKNRERKKKAEENKEEGQKKARIYKCEFFKSLSVQMRELRKLGQEVRVLCAELEAAEDECSPDYNYESDSEEANRSSKRARTSRS